MHLAHSILGIDLSSISGKISIYSPPTKLTVRVFVDYPADTLLILTNELAIQCFTVLENLKNKPILHF